MADWEFIFSSGAGGWATELFVKPDGTFTGSYYDLDMGDTGEDFEYIEDTPEYLPFAALINTVDSTAFFSENISDKNKVCLVNMDRPHGSLS